MYYARLYNNTCIQLAIILGGAGLGPFIDGGGGGGVVPSSVKCGVVHPPTPAPPGSRKRVGT